MIDATTFVLRIDPELEPTPADLEDPLFLAVWDAIKAWDIKRTQDEGYAGATGTDVMTILRAVRPLLPQHVTAFGMEKE